MSGIAVEGKEYEKGVETKAANFDRLARVYRWLEWLTFGPILGSCRCAFLDAMQDRRRAVVIGDGDGRFTARLLETNQHVSVEALDASEAMLGQLVRRAGANTSRVRARVADARGPISFEQSFDLVVTHFFLDCLTTGEVEWVVRGICGRLEPGARWVISEFAIPENLYGRLFARPVVAALYCAFGLLTGLRVRRLPLYRDVLERAGLVLVREQRRLKGLLVSELWQAGARDQSFSR